MKELLRTVLVLRPLRMFDFIIASVNIFLQLFEIYVDQKNAGGCHFLCDKPSYKSLGFQQPLVDNFDYEHLNCFRIYSNSPVYELVAVLIFFACFL